MKKLVILGGGAVVRECFLPAIESLGLLAQLTVVDSSPGVTSLSAQYPDTQFISAGFEDWFRTCSPNTYAAAIVALPNVCHEAAVRLAFARGLDVLCEKPLTLGSEICRDLADRAIFSGRLLAVNMVRRLYPTVAITRYALKRGLLGRLESIDIQHGSAYAWPAATLAPFRRENGGVLADMGVHYLDLLQSLAGELSPVHYEDDSQGGVEADLSYSLHSADGVQIRLALSRTRTLANRVLLKGTEGTLEFGVDDLTTCTLTDATGARISLSSAETFTSHNLPPTFIGCFARQVYSLLHRFENDNRSLVDGFDAAQTVALIEWAWKHRVPAALARPAVVSLEAEPSPVLITGATGFIGTHLVEELTARGFSDIAAIVRSPQNCAGIARFPVRFESGDLLDYATVREAVKGKRYIFHLAYGRDGERRRDATVLGTQNIVKAAIEEGCEAVVILSTAYVFGWPAGMIDESAPYQPTGGEYGKSKAEMERWCLAAAAASRRTRITILNPTCVYGPRGATYSSLPLKLAREGAFCWIDGGTGAANYTYVGNLIDAMLLAAACPGAHGERFIVNDDTTTWRAFLTPVLETWLSHIPSFTPAELKRLEGLQRYGPLQTARLLGGSKEVRGIVRKTRLGAAASAALRRLGPSLRNTLLPPQGALPKPSAGSGHVISAPPAWLAELFPNYGTRFSSAKARRILGWAPRVLLPEGQQRTIEYLRSINLREKAVEQHVCAD